MAQKTAELKNSFSRGVLDPDLWERIDLEHYYLALKRGLNMVSIPQGGIKRRPGTLLRTRLRRRIAPVPVTGTMVTTFAGGTVANLIDQSKTTLFTTTAVTGTTFPLFEVDFGQNVNVTFVDLIAFSAASGSANRCLSLEYWTGAAWAPMPGSANPNLSPYRSITQTARTRRFGGAPGSVFSARQWRAVLYANPPAASNQPVGYVPSSAAITSLGAISIGGLRFWVETLQPSNVRLLPFAKSVNDVFELVLSDRNIDVFQLGAYCASAAVAVDYQIVRECKFEQSLDTLILFHKDVTQPWIVRQGAADEWNTGFQTWTNLPALTANTAFSGNADDVQRLDFQNMAPGDTFCFALGDMLTGILTYSTQNQLASDLQNALLALPGVNASSLIVTVLSQTPLSLSVTFTGSNGGRRWWPIFLVPVSLP